MGRMHTPWPPTATRPPLHARPTRLLYVWHSPQWYNGQRVPEYHSCPAPGKWYGVMLTLRRRTPSSSSPRHVMCRTLAVTLDGRFPPRKLAALQLCSFAAYVTRPAWGSSGRTPRHLRGCSVHVDLCCVPPGHLATCVIRRSAHSILPARTDSSPISPYICDRDHMAL